MKSIMSSFPLPRTQLILLSVLCLNAAANFLPITNPPVSAEPAAPSLCRTHDDGPFDIKAIVVCPTKMSGAYLFPDFFVVGTDGTRRRGCFLWTLNDTLVDSAKKCLEALVREKSRAGRDGPRSGRRRHTTTCGGEEGYYRPPYHGRYYGGAESSTSEMSVMNAPLLETMSVLSVETSADSQFYRDWVLGAPDFRIHDGADFENHMFRFEMFVRRGADNATGFREFLKPERRAAQEPSLRLTDVVLTPRLALELHRGGYLKKTEDFSAEGTRTQHGGISSMENFQTSSTGMYEFHSQLTVLQVSCGAGVPAPDNDNVVLDNSLPLHLYMHLNRLQELEARWLETGLPPVLPPLAFGRRETPAPKLRPHEQCCALPFCLNLCCLGSVFLPGPVLAVTLPVSPVAQAGLNVGGCCCALWCLDAQQGTDQDWCPRRCPCRRCPGAGMGALAWQRCVTNFYMVVRPMEERMAMARGADWARAAEWREFLRGERERAREGGEVLADRLEDERLMRDGAVVLGEEGL